MRFSLGTSTGSLGPSTLALAVATALLLSGCAGVPPGESAHVAAVDASVPFKIEGRLSARRASEGMTANFADPRTRQMIKSSTYLDAILHNAAIVRTDLGVNLASQGRLKEAIDQFEEALRLQPELAVARRRLTTAQQVRGGPREGADIR